MSPRATSLRFSRDEAPQNLTISVAAGDLYIPLTHPYVLKTIGNTPELITLQKGVPGQIIVIDIVAKGSGFCSLSFATATNIVAVAMADVGDKVIMFYVNDDMGWIILGCVGVSGPPDIVT